MDTVQDLKALEKLQGSENNAQVQSMTDQAESEETDRVEEATVASSVNTLVTN